MVAPALLMALETVKAMGPAAQGAVFTFTYHGTTRWWKKHCPAGMVITIPAWLVALLTLIGGVALVMYFIDQVTELLDKAGKKDKEKTEANKTWQEKTAEFWASTMPWNWDWSGGEKS